MVRSFDEEMRFIRKTGPCRFEIAKGFVPNMKVPGVFYVNEHLEHLMFEVTAFLCGCHPCFLTLSVMMIKLAMCRSWNKRARLAATVGFCRR